MHIQRTGIAVASALGAVGTFLPWIHVPVAGSVYGTAGDGWLTLIFFLIPLVLSVLGRRAEPLSRGRLIASIIMASLAGALVVWKFVAVLGAELMRPGVGLYLILLASLTLIVLGVVTKGRPAVAA